MGTENIWLLVDLNLLGKNSKRLLRPPVTHLQFFIAVVDVRKDTALGWWRSRLLCCFSRQALKKDCLGHLSPIFIAVVAVRKDSASFSGWIEGDPPKMTLALSFLSSSTQKDCLGHLSPIFIAAKRFCKFIVLVGGDLLKMTHALPLLSPSTPNDCLGHLSPILIAVEDVRKDSASFS